MSVSPFDYVNSITTSKKNMMRDTENDALAEKDYNPWIVNKALSYFKDTALIANEINVQYHLPKRAQYEFLLNIVRPNKRWAKWVKDESNEDLNSICEYYQCNSKIGREYLSLLNEKQINIIKTFIEKGGNKK